MEKKETVSVLVFDLKGKMAHFRKYYSNSSCLSYYIPPRTTITGIIAGLLGQPRDTYYEDFLLERCNIGVAVLSPLKKIIQKMNYLHVESVNDLNGYKGLPSQTPVELVIPQNIRNGEVCYRIWFSHQDREIISRLTELFSCSPAYLSRGVSLGLGCAQYLGWLEYVGLFEGNVIIGDVETEIMSVIPKSVLKYLQTDKIKNSTYYLVKEDIPLEFDKDRNITLKGKADMIINLTASPIPAIVSKHVKLNDESSICWLE